MNKTPETPLRSSHSHHNQGFYVSSSAFDASLSDQAQALWYVSAGVAELRTEPLPALQTGQVRVRTLFSALSRGTESLVFAGKVPEAEFTRMRAPVSYTHLTLPTKRIV